MKFREKIPQGLTYAIPVRANLKWRIDGEEAVVILKKNFTRFERFIQKFLKGPSYMRYRLDRLGTSIWQLCDGTHTVDEICTIMRERYQEEIEPVKKRVVLYLRMLLARGLIYFTSEKKNNSEH